MIVEEMERRFFELKGKLEVGVVSEEEFKAQVQKLRFQDKQGHWWMLGAQSGRWYMFDGTRWIPGYPPRDAIETSEPSTTEAREAAPTVTPTEAREAAPTVTPSEAREAAPTVTPSEAREAAPTVTPTEAREAAPDVTSTPQADQATLVVTPSAVAPEAEHIESTTRAHPALPPLAPSHPLPISGPVIIAGAAFIALLGVIAFWVVLDNVVPNRPISQFFAGLMGAPTPTRVPAAPTGPNIAPLLAQGDQLLLRSHIDVAIVQYQNAAQLAPTSAEPLVHWSRALAFKGLMADSLAKAQQAAQRAPNDAEVQAQLSRALAWSGQVDEAVKAGERALQLDLQNVNARANLAEAYLLARRTAEAQAMANGALQIAPSSAEAHRAQAWVYTILNQRENALNEWKQTIALEPNFYFRHFEYGEVLRMHFNAPDEAVAEHQKAVNLYGAYVPAINRLGLALLAANKPQEAIPTLRRALALDATGETYAHLGLAFGMANQCLQAIPYFEEALRLEPNNVLAQRSLADCRAGKTPALPPIQPLQIPLTPPIVTPK